MSSSQIYNLQEQINNLQSSVQYFQQVITNLQSSQTNNTSVILAIEALNNEIIDLSGQRTQLVGQ